ncbi:MAG: ABC transporter ATP-binding protein [Solirubrobacteraceae bacterium]
MSSLRSSASASRHRYGLLLAYTARRRRGLLGILVTTLLSSGAALLVPLPLKVLIDNVIGNEALPGIVAALPGTGTDQGVLVWVLVAEIGIFVVAAALDVAVTLLWIVVGQAMVYDVAKDMFGRVQRQGLRQQAQSSVGDTMERVAGDSWAVHTVVDELVFTPLHALVTMVGIALVMWNLAPDLTLVAFAVAPVMAAGSLLLGRRVRAVGEEQRDVQGKMQAHIQQTLTGISVVQAFVQEDRQRRRFDQLAVAAVRLKLRSTLIGGLNGLGTGLIGTLGAGLVLFLGARAVIRGDLTTGGLLVFVAYVANLQGQFLGLAGIYPALQEVRPSIDRALEVLDAPAEVGDRPDAVGLSRVRGDVTLEGVWFGYEPDRPVLRGVDLHAHRGEVVAIVGPTGAGKSTLVSLVLRFFDPDRGRVTLDGHDLRDLRLATVRDSVAIVLQESFLFPFSIAENIAYGRPGASRREVEAAARAANAHEFVSRLPEGYGTVVGERGATLSGGERQRVAIARALLKDAPVLILDEPTSALDAETEGLLMEALERLMAGRTTIIIAHRLSTIRRADQIVVLREGRVVERGGHDELVAAGGAYARMHTIQHGPSTTDVETA